MFKNSKATNTSQSQASILFERSLVWLRRDLRLKDHAVLAEATRLSKHVFVAFIFDTNILNKLKDKDDRRIIFLTETISELSKAIEAKGGSLIVKYGDPTILIPKLSETLDIGAVFCGKDYQQYSKDRDLKVEKLLNQAEKKLIRVKDHVVFESTEILTATGTPFKVFTPYKNMWLKTVRARDIEEKIPDYSKLAASNLGDPHELKDLGFLPNTLCIPSGESNARKMLGKFKTHISNYKIERNFPSLDTTSKLSMHFRFGTLSIREAIRLASEIRTEGSRTWLSELIWRDFYHMILDQYPHVEKSCFKTECDKLNWTGRPEHFEAWKEGQTGFPLVDAAMRHFKATGWMHNRLRMVVASFLTKDLLIDWKKGERYFAQKLLDYDCAANNGGWQWSASTGCDAQPYFRVFNPFSQSEKFDSDGEFIRKNVPELKNFSSKLIHRPFEATPMEQRAWNCIIGKDYPEPIVDHSVSRERAIQMFKEIKT